MIVNVHQAKAQLSQLLDAVERGEEVVLARANRPIAQLVPYHRPALQLGGFEGRIAMADDWESPDVEEQIVGLFEGSTCADS